MNAYETSAMVEEHGQVRLVGVPFEPGTEVEVTVRARLSSKANAETTPSAEAASGRAARLFAALNKARNTESIGPLRREELYDRQVLR